MIPTVVAAAWRLMFAAVAVGIGDRLFQLGPSALLLVDLHLLASLIFRHLMLWRLRLTTLLSSAGPV